ncbi:SRPBCC family protein [Sulfitobacter mediterraneus]|jgi:carbon monoxide dehydrogenase subunit G|uniref:SRPBCC family protein n=1 Tax=Sulfitobacter TaxID=60136 RepID=UPI001933BA2F|nr:MULTISPECIES: SRPBCC family protein [Sulfitobacter]MBM1633325.1 SRPBCC family protein [Sulfitobacter mediterraneus]MBM1640541.1 SRPBCC family protein [Sulfitobacter mediterraneus]MBM1645190.1 SRPBCC family protein [Sulfitobacter mediterraneus]MBM1648661.1 SRPBCC family protein [Sulfitobacter mediterraneus]MBM1652682.1 SRPBCC family protein [Sulfitobacter mediterraneus]
MKFSTREDLEAPIDAVFAMLCDFESFERAAMRRGADVRRVDRLDDPGIGMQWHAVFELRGKRRELQVEMVQFDRPNEMVIHSTSPGLIGEMRFELIALSRSRTRIRVELEIKPKNLSARLFVQSLKLAKASLTKKYKLRVADYATTMEERYLKQA